MILCIILALIIGLGVFLTVHAYLIQKNWRKCAESGKFSSVKKEPFTGALCLAALVHSCVNDAAFSAKILESVFGRRMDEWNSITKSVSDATSLNRDLLVENLVSIIRKQNDNYKLTYIPLIFKCLSAAEFMWNAKDQGEKPSEYMKTLLNFSIVSDEKADAYRILGLEPGAPAEKVRRAHRKLAARFHPDNGSGNLEMFMKIQTAYEMLK